MKFLELPLIVDVNVRLNQAVTQQFSGTSSGITLNFQRPGYLLQVWTIICWLDMAAWSGISEEKERFCSYSS